MKLTSFTAISLVLAGLGVLAFCSRSDACTRSSPISLYATFTNADAVVRATAVAYTIPPEGETWTTGIPDSQVLFKIEETLKGTDVPNTLLINGYLSEEDDFNDRPVPYKFVRPGGRHGSCFANTYRQGAEFLLVLKKTDSEFTPYWNALAPVNEQLQSSSDPWLLWTRNYLQELEEIVKTNSRAQEDDIREAVFLYQFQHNASGQQESAMVYCLSLGRDQDPSEEFMTRFQGHQPPVKKVSQCTVSAGEGVKDKETGKRGLIFRVGNIDWLSRDEVEVEGGYYEAGLSASGNIYSVVREGTRWVVKADRMLWVS